MLKVGTWLEGWYDEEKLWEILSDNGWSGYKHQKFSLKECLSLVIGEQEIINYQEDELETRTTAFVKLIRETEKAIQISVEYTTFELTVGEIEYEYSEKFSCWLPKSQIEITEGKIVIPAWLAKEKRLTRCGKKISIVKEFEI